MVSIKPRPRRRFPFWEIAHSALISVTRWAQNRMLADLAEDLGVKVEASSARRVDTKVGVACADVKAGEVVAVDVDGTVEPVNGAAAAPANQPSAWDQLKLSGQWVDPTCLNNPFAGVAARHASELHAYYGKPATSLTQSEITTFLALKQAAGKTVRIVDKPGAVADAQASAETAEAFLHAIGEQVPTDPLAAPKPTPEPEEHLELPRVAPTAIDTRPRAGDPAATSADETQLARLTWQPDMLRQPPLPVVTPPAGDPLVPRDPMRVGGSLSPSVSSRLLPPHESAALLVNSGLLFEVNRVVLHPLGLALVVQDDADGTAALAGVIDFRDDPEGIVFDEAELKSGAEKLRAYMAERGDAVVASRKHALGFVEQVDPLDDLHQHHGRLNRQGTAGALSTDHVNLAVENIKAAARAVPFRGSPTDLITDLTYAIQEELERAFRDGARRASSAA